MQDSGLPFGVLPVAACLRRGEHDAEAGAVRGAVQMQLAVSGAEGLASVSALEVRPRGERAQVERAGPADRAVAESLGRLGRLRAYGVRVDVFNVPSSVLASLPHSRSYPSSVSTLASA